MSLKEAIYSYLSTNQTFVNLVGINSSSLAPQLYAGFAPTNATLPYVTYGEDSGEPVKTFDGDCGFNKDRIVFDIYAETDESRDAIFTTMKSLLSGARGINRAGVYIQDVVMKNKREREIPPTDNSQIGTFQKQIEFDFSYNERPPSLV